MSVTQIKTARQKSEPDLISKLDVLELQQLVRLLEFRLDELESRMSDCENVVDVHYNILNEQGLAV